MHVFCALVCKYRLSSSPDNNLFDEAYDQDMTQSCAQAPILVALCRPLALSTLLVALYEQLLMMLWPLRVTEDGLLWTPSTVTFARA